MHLGLIGLFEGPPPPHDELLAAARAEAAQRAALSPARALRAAGGGAPGLARRPALRARVSRAPHRAARAGRGCRAAGARRPRHVPAARPRAAAVGAVGRRGAHRRALGAGRQAASRDGRRDLRLVAADGACSTSERDAAGARAGHLVAAARARRREPRQRRARRARPPARGPICAGPSRRSARRATWRRRSRTPRAGSRRSAGSRAPPCPRRSTVRSARIAAGAGRGPTSTDVRAIRRAHDDGLSVNDVVLAVITGGLRTLLSEAGEPRGPHGANARAGLRADAATRQAYRTTASRRCSPSCRSASRIRSRACTRCTRRCGG